MTSSDFPTVNTRTALNGANVPAAIEALHQAHNVTRPRTMADTLKAIALNLSVSLRTVQRWRKGTHRPSLANFDLLVAMVNLHQQSILARPSIRFPSAVATELHHVNAAIKHLETDAERAAMDALAADIKTFLSGAATAAEVAPRIANADPFELIRTADPAQMEIPF